MVLLCSVPVFPLCSDLSWALGRCKGMRDRGSPPSVAPQYFPVAPCQLQPFPYQLQLLKQLTVVVSHKIVCHNKNRPAGSPVIRTPRGHPLAPGTYLRWRLHSRIPWGRAHKSPEPPGAGRFRFRTPLAGVIPQDSRNLEGSGKTWGWLRSDQGDSNNLLSMAHQGSVSQFL